MSGFRDQPTAHGAEPDGPRETYGTRLARVMCPWS